MIEDGLRAYLLTIPAITNVVGTRIRPDKIHQSDVLPIILYEVTEEESATDLDGDGGFCMAKFTISCQAETRSVARGLAEEIRLALQGYEGPAGNETIDAAIVGKLRSGFVDAEEDSEKGFYAFERIVTIQYQETVAFP